MNRLIKAILLFFIRRIPLRKAIVFESHPDLSDNTYALYQELLKRRYNKKYKMYWMRTYQDGQEFELPDNVEEFYNEPASFSQSIKRAYILNTSKFIMDCNSFVQKRRKNQIRFHLGHGMPIKMDLNYSRHFGECDKYMVLSPFWKDIFTKKILVPEDKLCYYGYPRNDVLVHGSTNDGWTKSVEGFDKVVVWMPTYRQHRLHLDVAMSNQYPFGLPCVHNEMELEQLHELLVKNNILVLYRPHPVQELSFFENKSFSHIMIADDTYLSQHKISLYEMLSMVDGLITDYSSVYFDYLLTGKPIALTIEDKEEYFEHFTPAFIDYEKSIKGFLAKNFEELPKFFEDLASGRDSYLEKRRQATELFHADLSGNSANKIVDLLENEFGL